jgi:hypothetical protein
MPARQDRSNTGAYRTFPDFQFSFAGDQRRIADFDTRNIGDRVELSRYPFEWNPEIARPNYLAFNNRCGGRMLYRLTRGGTERDHCHKQSSKASTPLRCHLPPINYHRLAINPERFRGSTPKAFACRLFR